MTVRYDALALIRLAIPAALTLLLTNAYRVNDLFWVGRLIGDRGVAAQAAVSVASMVTIFCFAFYEGLSMGVLALSARAHGAGEGFRARRIFRISLGVALVLSAAVAAVGLGFLDPLSRLLLGLRAGESTIEFQELRNYLAPCLGGGLFLCLAPLVSHAFLAMRDSRTPLVLEILAVVANTIFNAILVPDFGAAGAGYATVLSRVLSVSLGLWLLHRKLPSSGVPELRTVGRILRRIATVGLPAVFAIAVYSLAYQIVLATSFAPFGAVGRAALGIGFTIEGLAFCMIWGLANACGSLVGNALGADRLDEAKRIVARATRIVLALVVPLTLVFLLVPEELAGLLTDDEATRAEVARYLRILAWSQWAVGLQGVQENALYSAGYALPPCLASAFWNLSRIPLCALFAHEMGHGIAGIWWAINVTAYGKAATATWLLHRGNWARPGSD